MTRNTVVSVEHVTKTYGNFRAVNDLTFDVLSGEIFAMLETTARANRPPSA